MAKQDSATTSNGSMLATAATVARTAGHLAPLVKDALRRNHEDTNDEAKEYELEVATPFGKVEFEFEPKSKDAEKQRRKREHDEAGALERARKQQARHEEKATRALATAGKGGGKLMPILVVLVVAGALFAVAWWLFARPPEDAFDQVPEDFRTPETESASEPPQGFVAKLRLRAKTAIRAGQRASREEQAEQERHVRELTGQS